MINRDSVAAVGSEARGSNYLSRNGPEFPDSAVVYLDRIELGDANRLRNIINFHQPDAGGAGFSANDRRVSSWRYCFHERGLFIVIGT